MPLSPRAFSLTFAYNQDSKLYQGGISYDVGQRVNAGAETPHDPAP